MNAPQLKMHDNFARALADYRVSNRAQAILDRLKLVLLVGPFASGRNTLINDLVKSGKYYYIISDTTRPPQVRDGQLEQNGVQYFFRSEQAILADLQNGEFLEAEIIHGQQVSGISVRELETAQEESKIAITDVEIVGIDNVKKAKPDTVAIMLLPPSFKEWQRRIAGRGHLPPQEYGRRMQTALRIFDAGTKKDYFQFVIAEDVENSIAIIDQLANGGDNPHQARGRELIAQLFSETQKAIDL